MNGKRPSYHAADPHSSKRHFDECSQDDGYWEEEYTSRGYVKEAYYNDTKFDIDT